MAVEHGRNSRREEIASWQDQLDSTPADIAYFRAPHVELKLYARDVLTDFQNVLSKLHEGIVYRIEFPQKPLISYAPLWQEILNLLEQERQERTLQHLQVWQEYQEQGIIEVYFSSLVASVR